MQIKLTFRPWKSQRPRHKTISISLYISLYVSVCLSISVCLLSLCPTFYMSFILSVSLSPCPSFCMSVSLSVIMYVCHSICLSVRHSVCLSFYLSLCPSFCLSLCSSFCMSVILSVPLSVSLYFCTIVSLSVSLSVSLYFCTIASLSVSVPQCSLKPRLSDRFNLAITITDNNNRTNSTNWIKTPEVKQSKGYLNFKLKVLAGACSILLHSSTVCPRNLDPI